MQLDAAQETPTESHVSSPSGVKHQPISILATKAQMNIKI